MRNPWTIKLELVEGCNRACMFCSCAFEPLHNKYKYASLELVEKVARDVSDWLPKVRFEHGQAGEPTLHPRFLDAIRIEREFNPKAQITVTTNGSVLAAGGSRRMHGRLEWYFSAGINHVIMDTYLPERDTLRATVGGLPNGTYQVCEYGEYQPHRYAGSKQRVLILMDDMLVLSDHDLRKRIGNQAGVLATSQGLKNLASVGVANSAVRITTPLMKKCARPFRELLIKFDGSVILCCDDSFRIALVTRGYPGLGTPLVFGNASEDSLRYIWFHSDKLDAARSLLYRKNRGFSPCRECNYRGGFRLGIGLEDPHPTVTSSELLRTMGAR